MKLSYDEIRRIHRLEKNTSQVVEVEPEFFNELFEFLNTEKKSYLESLKNFSSSGQNDFSNMRKMIEEIFSMRQKKIVGMALVASRTHEFSESHLAMQERELFRKIHTLLAEHNLILEGLFADPNPRQSAANPGLETLRVKIVSDIPSFVGSDMKEYGPFQKDDTVDLPLRVARLLNQRNLAVVFEKVV